MRQTTSDTSDSQTAPVNTEETAPESNSDETTATFDETTETQKTPVESGESESP